MLVSKRLYLNHDGSLPFAVDSTSLGSEAGFPKAQGGTKMLEDCPG